jgi:SpoVK/Ycf46/Vps4 family AAA+-type ATPase
MYRIFSRLVPLIRLLLFVAGTAKTTICESLAQRMGFDFVVIDTAAFLADGLSNVAARIRYVFRRLMALRECVILFDEIEEFALDRETPGLSMESRMLTTALLTAINDLRRTKQSVFFIATNRLRAFDSAITRRGRFDMQLFAGTPNLKSRVIQFQEKLAGVGLEDEAKDQAIESYRSFLEEVWAQDAMYMNYLEGMVGPVFM